MKMTLDTDDSGFFDEYDTSSPSCCCRCSRYQKP